MRDWPDDRHQCSQTTGPILYSPTDFLADFQVCFRGYLSSSIRRKPTTPNLF